MEFKELLMGRYATKKFDGKKIDDDILEEILDMIRFAPSALNIQPWKIKVVGDEETKKKLSTASMDQPQINSCSHLLVFCANTDLDALAQKNLKMMKDNGVPEEMVKGYENVLNTFIGNYDSKTGLVEAQENVFLAVMTAIYAAKSLGVDSCPMQGFDPKAYADILEVPSGIVPTMIVPLGYPADKQMPKMRFSKEEIFF